MTAGHQWSGWPGAYCQKCGADDYIELAIAESLYDPWNDKWVSPEAEKEYTQQPCKWAEWDFQLITELLEALRDLVERRGEPQGRLDRAIAIIAKAEDVANRVGSSREHGHRDLLRGRLRIPGGIMTEIRDRDELWCRCLCATLDPREIAKVLGVFNSVRPDKPRPRSL